MDCRYRQSINPTEEHGMESQTGKLPQGSLAKPITSQNATTETPVRVEIGAGAMPPKIALARTGKPVKVEIGGGAIPPKVALLRSRQR
jgi:hypothetical protein